MEFKGFQTIAGINWQGEERNMNSSEANIRSALLELEKSLWVVRDHEKISLISAEKACPSADGFSILGMVPAMAMGKLGDLDFCKTYGTSYACYAGAMANGISSEEFVISLGKAGFMGSYGAGGLSPARIKSAIQKIKEALPSGPYAFNLLNSPNEPAMEERAVEPLPEPSRSGD